MSKARKSNFELMRIISMILIIVWHIIIHGHIIEHTIGTINFILNMILSICIVHVNSFVLLSGYFGYDKKSSINKVIKLLNMTLFYSALIVIICTKLNLINLDSNVEFLKQFSYIPFSQYWFIKTYMLLYLLSPFINKLINNLNKNQYRTLLLVSFLIFSIIPVFSGEQIFNVNQGYSLYNFIFLYILGAYLRIYPLDKSKVFEKLNKNKLRLILIVSFILLALFNVSLLYLGKYLEKIDSNILKEIAGYIKRGFVSYSSPIVIIQTVCYFLYFSKLNINSKVINYVSSCMFGIYLIHDNYIIRSFIYRMLKVDLGIMIFSKHIFLEILLCTFIIFFISLFIEILRKLLFKLLRKIKFIDRLLNNIINYIKSVSSFDC